jgi:hypothetical protein
MLRFTSVFLFLSPASRFFAWIISLFSAPREIFNFKSLYALNVSETSLLNKIVS